MSTAIAIALGVVGGLIGAIPFYAARKKAKERLKTDGMGGIFIGLVATMISFAVMVILFFVCFLIARDYLLPFALSALVVFMLAMVAYTVILMRK